MVGLSKWRNEWAMCVTDDSKICSSDSGVPGSFSIQSIAIETPEKRGVLAPLFREPLYPSLAQEAGSD